MNIILFSKLEDISKIFLNYKKLTKKSELRGNVTSKTFKSIFEMFERVFPDKIDGDSTPSTRSSFTSSSRLMVARSCQLPPSSSAVETKVTISEASTALPPSTLQRSFVSNRWPASLPMLRHNLYWLKGNQTPCICIGLDRASLRNPDAEPQLRVIPISITTYNHETKVAASSLGPLHDLVLDNQCNCPRSSAFAKALIMFYNWEIAERDNCVWYEYPAFIIHFLSHPPVWSSWRQKAERASRGSKDDRTVIYFNALKEELELQDVDDRSEGIDFPWDDTAVQQSQEDSSTSDDDDDDDSDNDEDDDDEDDGASDEGGGKSSSEKVKIIDPRARQFVHSSDDDNEEEISKAKFKEAQQRKLLQKEQELQRKARAIQLKVAARLREEEERQKEIERRRDQLEALAPNSMYWIPRALLPAICISHKRIIVGGQPTWKLTIKPICCTSYHYIVEVDRNNVEILTEENLRQCRDERTVDFTYALIDFAEIQKEDYCEQISVLAPDKPNCHDSVFVWPGFVTDLMEGYRDWTGWRKAAERSVIGRKESRKQAYLNAILADFDSLQTEIYMQVDMESEILFDQSNDGKRTRENSDSYHDNDDEVMFSPSMIQRRRIAVDDSDGDDEIFFK